MAGSPHILVVGFGSAGRRHAQNLFRRGATISVVDTRSDRLSAEGVHVQAAFAEIDAALSHGPYDGAVVATPTAFHVEQTERLLAGGCRVLLEKPVAVDLNSAKRLAAAEADMGLPILLGYTWRWWPPLKEFRRRLRQGAIGRPLRAEFVMASHLEDWHPWEPLKDFFMGRADLGGGALLDESHWIDQMVWMLGEPVEICAAVEKVSRLPIDSDDHVELQAYYPDGLRVRVHLDLYTRPTERSIVIVGDKGTLKWSFERNVIAEHHSDDRGWQETLFAGERNDMFDALAGEFLDVRRGATSPSCTVADGLAVLRIVDAARMSQRRDGRKTAPAC
ncbi:MAG TPA: Gfo/Idh/MocA family oxidoreductase [Xanthobacteraceae bacterium]|nr:Gfo/Idh/MocA family oxidoreductase [Xanthobacteraceae bacterium]